MMSKVQLQISTHLPRNYSVRTQKNIFSRRISPLIKILKESVINKAKRVLDNFITFGKINQLILSKL